MLEAIYDLGKLIMEKEDLDKISVLLDSEKLNKNTKDVIIINLIENDDGSFAYDKTYQEEFDSNKNDKYLYKKGSSRGIDITPSCLLTEPDKTFNNKFLKWFDKNKSKHEMYNKINELLTSKKELIFEDLVTLHASLEIKNTNTLLTLIITKNNEDFYIGDLDCFRDILIESATEKFYKTGKKKVKGNSTCLLCDEQKEVYGLVSSAVGFKFSTHDKIGNIPGANIENQWKLIPICSDCALYLEAGKKFIDEYLSFSEFGLTYQVIPKFLFDSEKGFEKLYMLLKSNALKEKQNSENVVDIEDKLELLTKSMDEIVEFKFLFYEANNNAFNILSYVESVIPSWVNKLYSTQEEISQYAIFQDEYLKDILGNKNEGDLIQRINFYSKFYKITPKKWYWRFIKDFIQSSNKSNKLYIDLVTKIINQRKIDYSMLLSRVMSKLRSNWRNNERHYALKVNVLESLMLFIFLNKLNLIKGEKIMENDGEFNIKSMLNTSSKKACFLLGALTRRLLNAQYNKLGSSPFYNKLWGLSLDQGKIKKLYPMVINKLREYKKAYPDLEEEISKYLIESEDNWKLKKDETSYFFVLGFTLPYFNNKNNEENGDLNE